MRAATLAAAVALGGFVASSPPGIQVLRVSPALQGASPTSIVTITFDRPVAGQLDGTIDPKTVFSISPSVPGTVEWRDPITIRFTPSTTLTPSTTYTVTIASTLRAMDGERLEQPYSFSFRVGGPAPIDGTPVNRYSHPRFLPPNSEFDVLVSSPVDLDVVSRTARLEFPSQCEGSSLIRVSASSQRLVNDSDPERFRSSWDYRPDVRLRSLRRVVHLKPDRRLPSDCEGRLVIPSSLDGTANATTVHWDFRTYGPFRIVSTRCTNSPLCPAGFAQLEFSTPVKGADVARAIHLRPPMTAEMPFTIGDTAEESPWWTLEATLRTRSRYTITIDTSLRDVFGQRLQGPRTREFATTGYRSSVEYPTGRMLVERESFRTLAVKHVNVDSLYVTIAPVPESLEARLLAAPTWNIAEAWQLLEAGATRRSIAVRAALDTPLVSAVRLPVSNAARPGSPTLMAVRIGGHGDTLLADNSGIALIQVTDLGVAARLGEEEALVWVTTVHDGLARAGAAVTLFDYKGAVRARGTTDAQGVVRLNGWRPDSVAEGDERVSRGFEGYVSVAYNNDRALVAFDSYSYELSPWRYNLSSAYGSQRIPAAAAVFTERGIYRPGETVYAKAIVRTGALGALRAPTRGDSLRWQFYDREDGALRDTTVAVSAFGTADQALAIPADQALGTYRVGVQIKRGGKWVELANAYYRVAEYRPPEFLVGVTSDTTPRFAGDSLRATVEARYLFGAPMARTPVAWTARRAPMWPWELRIPGADGWAIGESGYWWEDEGDEGSDDRPRVETIASGTDTLDASGHVTVRVPIGVPKGGRPARITVEARVTDVNRQTVASATSAVVHPAAFYIGAKPSGDEYFWRSGTPVEIGLLALTPGGRRVAGVVVHGTIVRREWHRVQRRRGGLDERVGEWVSDTVAQCDATTADAPVPCRFTPAMGGSYIMTFKARDGGGRIASTSFYRWATGRDWVPWGDETQFKMDVIHDKDRYDVGDTATVLFASPFTNAEALITVEREGIIEHRRVRITAGATSLKFPITEAYVPNVFVSIVVTRGRTAPAGGIADPGRPALRVGYAELTVTPGVKRLRVAVRPRADEYRPGDSARVHVQVRDSRGTGRRSEVTLWAVDEGVLALTGYQTPDPVDLLYRARGVGMRLASNLISIAAQVLDSEGVSIKGDRAPGGGGGLENGDILRSRFSSTAFFLGSVETDANGEADAAAKLPDNLTTFRVMAVAVTPGDRYGSGESPMLVTRPLLARPALPRFLRRDDRFVAGVVVNSRGGGTPTVRVRANLRGAVLTEASPLRTATLAAGRGTEVRFVMRDTAADTASFRFDVTNGRDSDAVLTRLPVRSSFTPRSYSAAGVVRLTSTSELVLPADIDPVRSRVVFGIGATPLAIVRGMYRQLAIYPFDCTEQIASEILPLTALMRADTAGARLVPANARRQLEEGVTSLVRRQRPDGGIGLWNAEDWTSPWLTTHAGEALLAARAAGVTVRDTVLAGIAAYLTRSVHQALDEKVPIFVWLKFDYIRLAEQVAAVDFLSRFGRPDIPAENQLLRSAAQMAIEDRVRMAIVLARRGQGTDARALLNPILAQVRVEGRRAMLPEAAYRNHYFHSPRRPIARLLTATLMISPGHALIGPLVETLVEQNASARWSPWNTQDYGSAVEALIEFNARQRRAVQRGFTVASGGRVLFRSTGEGPQEFTSDLAGLLTAAEEGRQKLRVTVAASSGADEAPLFYHVTVHEVPRVRPVTPDEQGIAVERWYEDYGTGRPIISVQEGALVRVRLRITLPSERQFLALTDPLPAGLEAVDLSLRTTGGLGPDKLQVQETEGEREETTDGYYRYGWYYGSWDSGWWSPFDHRELRDDRVAWVATYLWRGTYTASYVARATTPGVFMRPPAHAEEMYNPAVQGRSDGGVFTVTRRR